jgi:hypothetical protein
MSLEISSGGKMYTVIKKFVFSVVLVLMVTATGAWQSTSSAFAAADAPETPLAPGLTWNQLGQSTRVLQMSIQGDALEISGETFQTAEKFLDGVPQEVQDFYSNVGLYKLGWVSDNAYEAADGLHRTFYHEAGYYLSVDYLKCPDDANSTCIMVWKSNSKEAGKSITIPVTKTPEVGASATTFFKKLPLDGSTGLSTSSVFLSWSTYSTAQKYSYCVKEAVECDPSDPNWTGTYLNTSITIGGLSPSVKYKWQVKAITNLNVVPKPYVLANDGVWWNFTTTFSAVRISGNAGISYAVLKWVDGVNKSVTANSVGDYAINVRRGWTGTITPSKSGYTFLPPSHSYTNLTTNMTGQNFTALGAHTISGNAGVAGATLSYTDGVARTVTSNSTGGYSLAVSYNWSGTVTPSRVGFTFNPVNIAYTNVTTNLIGQNYTATRIRFTISGNAGAAGAVMKYLDGVAKSVTADATGNYSISVPYNWSGTITPTKAGAYFTPVNMVYTGVKANFVNQNYSVYYKALFRSVGINDGTLFESASGSGVGGKINTAAQMIYVGDHAANIQIMGMLSFDTSTLPDTANISSAKLRLTKYSLVGVDPNATLGALVFDIGNPFFGSGLGLALEDFAATATMNEAGQMPKTPAGALYIGPFVSGAFPSINKTGTTQLRLRFQTSTNNNNLANYLGFYSGDSLTVGYRPLLEIQYTLP